MNQKLFILLLAVMFFSGLVPFISALPSPRRDCPDPAETPFCD
ncbi:918_t:CDS:1, partial [Dentiscutata heterogama]